MKSAGNLIIMLLLLLPFVIGANTYSERINPSSIKIYQTATDYKFKDAAALIEKTIPSSSVSPVENLSVINYYWWKLISGDRNGYFAQSIYTKVDALHRNYSKPGVSINDELLFYLVSVYAFEARVCLLDHSYRRAITSLSKYYSVLKTSFGKENLHPELNLTTGLFYFFIAHAREKLPVFSPILKTYYNGSKQSGYDMIVKASKIDNEIVSEQSMYFLMKINFDISENYNLSEYYCRKLISRYPGNLLYEYYLFKIFIATDQKIKTRDQILVIHYYSENNKQLTYDESTFYVNKAKNEFAEKYQQ